MSLVAVLAALTSAALVVASASVPEAIRRRSSPVIIPPSELSIHHRHPNIPVFKKYDPVAIRKLSEAMRQKFLEEDKGTTVVPKDGAKGDDLKLQREIIAEFARRNAAPAQRLAYFAWVKRMDGMVIRGWQGKILSAEGRSGDWAVKVRMRPYIVSYHGGVPFTPEYHDEVYTYEGGKLRLLGVEPGPETRIFIID